MTARTIPTLPTWTAGTRILASLLANMVSYQQFFADPPMFRMRQTIAQSIPNATQTIVTNDTSEYDTDSGRGGSTPWSYTIPVGMGGRWTFVNHVPLSSATSQERDSFVFKNGAAVVGVQYTLTTGSVCSLFTLATVPVSAGDVMTSAVFQQSGGAVNTFIGTDLLPTFEGRLISLANP